MMLRILPVRPLVFGTQKAQPNALNKYLLDAALALIPPGKGSCETRPINGTTYSLFIPTPDEPGDYLLHIHSQKKVVDYLFSPGKPKLSILSGSTTIETDNFSEVNKALAKFTQDNIDLNQWNT